MKYLDMSRMWIFPEKKNPFFYFCTSQGITSHLKCLAQELPGVRPSS